MLRQWLRVSRAARHLALRTHRAARSWGGAWGRRRGALPVWNRAIRPRSPDFHGAWRAPRTVSTPSRFQRGALCGRPRLW